jgi:hypothetical protein
MSKSFFVNQKQKYFTGPLAFGLAVSGPGLFLAKISGMSSSLDSSSESFSTFFLIGSLGVGSSFFSRPIFFGGRPYWVVNFGAKGVITAVRSLLLAELCLKGFSPLCDCRHDRFQ